MLFSIFLMLKLAPHGPTRSRPYYEVICQGLNVTLPDCEMSLNQSFKKIRQMQDQPFANIDLAINEMLKHTTLGYDFQVAICRNYMEEGSLTECLDLLDKSLSKLNVLLGEIDATKRREKRSKRGRYNGKISNDLNEALLFNIPRSPRHKVRENNPASSSTTPERPAGCIHEPLSNPEVTEIERTPTNRRPPLSHLLDYFNRSFKYVFTKKGTTFSYMERDRPVAVISFKRRLNLSGNVADRESAPAKRCRERVVERVNALRGILNLNDYDCGHILAHRLGKALWHV